MLYFIYALIWVIFIQGPLALVGAFFDVFKYLSFNVLRDLIFGTNVNFSFQTIPPAFWAMAIFACGLLVFLFTVNFVKLTFSEATEVRFRIVQSS